MILHNRKRKNYDRKNDERNEEEKKNIYDRDIIYEQIYSLPKKNKPRCLVISDYKNNLLRYFSNIVKVENYGSKDFRSKWYIHFYKICLYNEKIYGGVTGGNKKNIDKLIMEYNVEDVLRKLQTLVVRRLDCENLYYQKILVITCLLFDFFQNKKHVNIKSLKHLEGEEDDTKNTENDPNVEDDEEENDKKNNIDDKNIEYLNGKHIKDKYNKKVSKKRSRKNSSRSNYYDEYDDSIYSSNKDEDSSEYMMANRRKDHKIEIRKDHPGDINYHKNYYIIEFKNILYNEKKKFNNLEIFYHISNFIIHRYWYSQEYSTYNIFIWFLNYMHSKLEIRKSIQKINEQLEMFINIHPKIFNISHAKKKRKKNNNNSYNTNSTGRYFENGVLDYPYIKNRQKQIGGGFSDMADVEKKNKQNLPNLNTFGNNVMNNHSFFNNTMNNINNKNITLTNNMNNNGTTNGLSLNSFNSPFKSFDQSNNIFSSKNGENSLFKKTITLTNNLSNNNNNNNINSNNLSSSSLFNNSFGNNTSTGNNTAGSGLSKFNLGFSNIQNNNNNNNMNAFNVGMNKTNIMTPGSSLFGDKSMLSNNTSNVINMNNANNINSMNNNLLLNSTQNKQVNLFENNSNNNNNNMSNVNKSTNGLFGFEKNNFNSIFGNNSNKEKTNIFSFNSNQSQNTLFENKQINNISNTMSNNKDILGNTQNNSVSNNLFGSNITNVNSNMSLNSKSLFDNSMNNQKSNIFSSVKPNESLFSSNNNNNNSNSSTTVASGPSNIFGAPLSNTQQSPFSKTTNNTFGNLNIDSNNNNNNNNMIITGNGANNNTGLNFNSSNITNSVTQMNVNNQTFNNPLNNVVQNDNNLINLFNNENGSKELFKDLKINNDSGPKFTVNKKPLFSRRATKNSTLSTNTLNQENNIFSSSYMNKDNLLNNQEKPLKVIFGQNNTSNENVTNVNTTINSSSVNNTTLFNAPNNNNNNNNILSTNVEKNLFGQTNNLLKGSSSIMFNSASISGTTNTINNNIDNNNNNNSSSLNNNSSGGISGGLFGNKNLFGNTTNLFGNNNNNNNNNITNNNSDNVENNMLFNCNDPNNNTPNLSIPVKKLTLEERKKKTSKNSMLSLFSNNNNNTNENQSADNTLNDLSKNFINNNTTNLNNTSSLFNFKSNNENNNDNTTQTTSTIFGFNTKDKQTTWGDNKITFGLSNNNLLANQENKETNKNTLDNVSSTNTTENKPAKKINIFGSSGSLFKTTEKTDEKTDEKEDDKEKQKTSEENKIKNIFQFNTKDEKNDNKGETKDNLLSKSDVNINKESDKEKNNKEENVVKGTIFGFSKDKDSLFGSSINNDDKSKINLFGSTMNDGDKNKTNLFGSLNKDDKDKPSIFGFSSNKDDKDKAPIFGSPSNKDDKDKATIFGFSSNKDDKDKAPIFGSPSNKDDKDKATIFGSPSNKDDKDKAPNFGFSSNKDDKDKAPIFGFSSNKDDKDKAPIFGSPSNKDDKDKAPIFGSPSNKDDKDKTPIFGSPSNKDDKDKTPIFGSPSNKDDKDKTAIFGGSTFGNNKSPMFGQGILNKGDNVSVPVFGNTVTSTDNDKSKLKLFNGNKDKEETKENVFISKDNINNNIFNNDNMKYVLSVTKVDDENKSKPNINYDDVLNRKRRRNVDDKNETNSNADERDKDDDRYGRKQVGKGFNVNSSNVSNDKNNLKNKRNENNMFNNDEDLFLKKSKVGNALNATKNMLETLKYDNIPSKDILNESIVNKNMDTSENVIVEHNVLNASATFLEDGKNNNMINMNNYSDDKDGFFSSSQIGNKISPIKDATIKEVNINNRDMNENNSNTYLTHNNNNNNMMVMMNNVKNDEGNKMHLINKQYIKDKGLYDSLYDNNDYENLNVREYLMDINNEHNNYNDNIRNNKKGINNNNNNNNSTYVNKKEMDRIVQYNKKISFDDIVVDLDKDMIDLNELRQNLFLCAINFHLNYWAEKVILFYPHNEKINKYCTKLIRIKNEFDDTYDFSLFEYIHEISRKLLKTLDRNSCIYESVVFLSAENLYVLKNAQLSLFEAFIIYHFWYQKNSVDIKKNFRNFLYTNKIYPCYVNYYMNMYKNYKSFNGKSAEFNKNMSKRIRDNDHMVSNMNHMEDANHMKDLNHNNNGDIKTYQGNFLNVENNNSSRHSSKGGSFLLPPSSASNGNSKYSVVNLKHCSSASNRTHASDYSNNRSEESDYSSSDKKGYKNGNMNTNSNSSYDDYTSDCNKSQSNDYSEDSQRGRENKYDVYSDRRNRNKDDNDDNDDNTYDEYNDSRNTYSYESNSDESNSLNKRRRKRKMNNNRNLKKNGTKYNKYKKKNVNENSLIDILNSNSSSSENSSDILDNNSNMDEPLNMNIKEKYIYFSKEKKKKKKKLILPGHIKIKKLSACECVLLELLLKNDILNVLRKYKIFKTEKYEYLYVNLLAMLKHYNYFSTIESDENINENKEKYHKNMTNMKQNNNNNNNYNNNNNRNLKRISEHLNSNCIINTKNDKINILKKICDKNLLYYINMQLKNISHLISYKEIEIGCTYLNNIKNNLYVMVQLPLILYNVLFEKTINSFNDYIILDNFFRNSCVYTDFRYEYIFKTKIAYMLIKKFYAADDIENTIRFAIYFEECKNKTQKNNIYNDYIFHKNLINSYIKVHEHIVPSEWFHLQNYNTGHKNSGSVSNSRSDSISGSNNLNDMNDSEYLDYYSFFFKDISKYIKFHIIEKIINSNIYGLHKEDYSINGCNKSDDSSMINNKPYNIITSNNYNNNNNNDNIHYEERHFSCYFLYMVNKSILDELVNIYSLKGEYFYKRISTCLIKSSLVKDYEKSQNKHFHMYVQLANINHFMKNHFFEYINFFKKKELYHIEKTKNEDEIMENLTNVIKANGKKIILVINTLVEIINKIEREIIKDINIFVTINFRNLIIDTLYLFKYIFNNKEFSLSMVDDLYRNVIIFNDVINSTWKDDVHFYPKEQIKELYTHIRHKFMNQNMIN
ncbi:hypothetical protein PFDG_01995 [Plasmodium falciparum Dd2]|uniref:Nucleoporin NUP313 n=1 Tax=Plasmodium falciparum (isolate Dd2) TaxID=57267 RepID=A0A0L7M1C2_PLAF4|nr:hypothetical protein PFDG_01995 [Plasmodium falciparum Dd2]